MLCEVACVPCPGVWLRLAVPRGLNLLPLIVLCLFTGWLFFQLSDAEPESFGKLAFPLHLPVTFRKGFSLLSLKDRWISLLEIVSNSMVLPYGFEIPHSYPGCVSVLARSWLWSFLPSFLRSSQQC